MVDFLVAMALVVLVACLVYVQFRDRRRANAGSAVQIDQSKDSLRWLRRIPLIVASVAGLIKPLVIFIFSQPGVRLFLIGVSVLGAFEAPDVIDGIGWRPHDTTTVVSGAEWWLGEYRTCTAAPDEQGNITTLSCDLGVGLGDVPLRVLPVRYWGRIRRPDLKRTWTASDIDHHWRWRCQRKTESLTCWAED